MSAPGTCSLTIASPAGAFPPRSILAGNLIRFLVVITDIAGIPADTTSLDVYVGTNYYDEELLTSVNDSVGHWHADWDTTGVTAGTYYCVVTGTGTLEVSAEIGVSIKEPHL